MHSTHSPGTALGPLSGSGDGADDHGGRDGARQESRHPTDGCDENPDDGSSHRSGGAAPDPAIELDVDPDVDVDVDVDRDLDRDPAGLGTARSTWPMDRQAAATFPAVATSVARARHFVRITAAMWRLAPDTLADTELCMSELVGNAVRHTRSRRLHCRLWSARGMLFVEVDDEDLGEIPRIERPGDDDEAGRGMQLIDTFSSAWGAIPRPGAGGKTVWAALPLPR